MGKTVTRYDILISCPGDIESELKVIDSVIEQFNQLFSDKLNIMLRTLYWKKSSYSESGGKPQELLNKQIVNNSDAAIALFWTRFGVPTDEYKSGSEEEIQIMLDAGKQVFIGFSDKPIEPKLVDTDQLQAVKAFREEYSDKGIYFSYSTDEDLKSTLFAHLSQHFLSKQKDDAERQDKIKLRLKCIENEELTEKLVVKAFISQESLISDYYKSTLSELFQKASGFYIPEPQQIEQEKKNLYSTPVMGGLKSNWFGGKGSPIDLLYTPFAFPENKKAFVKKAAQELGIEEMLPSDFFYLGSLKQGQREGFGNSGYDYKGTDDEIKKHESLQEIISCYIDYKYMLNFEKAYSAQYYLRFALANEGKRPDEDIDLLLFFPVGKILKCEDFPKLDEDTAEYINNTIGCESLFSIESSICYNDYLSSQRRGSVEPPVVRPPVLSGYTDTNVLEDFTDEIDEIFRYEFFNKNGQDVLKLHFDYIKQNTAVAFPSLLFVDRSIDNIAYEIRSKNNPDIIYGLIKTYEE